MSERSERRKIAIFGRFWPCKAVTAVFTLINQKNVKLFETLKILTLGPITRS